MRQLLPVAIAALALLPVTLHAQTVMPSRGAVSGRVVDAETGEALAGATVRLMRADSSGVTPTSQGAVAAPDGTFSIAQHDTAGIVIEISMLGYAPRSVHVSAGDVGTIELEPRAHTERTVEVRAARRTRSVEDACCRVESIREEVQQHSPFSPSAIDVLRRYSSCTSTRVSCALDGSQSIRLRGLEPTYINVLIDGMPAISGLGTFYGLGMIPSQALQTIRISEGASSGAAGNGAVSGVVDLQLRMPTEEAEIDIGGNLTGSGPMPEERDLNLAYTGLAGDVGIAAFASLNNHRRDDGPVPGSYDRLSVLTKANVMLDEATELTATILGGGERRTGRSPPLGDQGESVDHRRVDGSATLAHTFADESEIVVRALASSAGVDATYPAGTLDADQQIFYGALVHNREIGDNSIALGLEARADRVSSVGATIDYSSSVLSAYLQDELWLTDALTVLGSLRYDRHSDAGGIVSPRAAIRLEPEANLTMRLMAGQGFKAQANFDEEEHRALHGGYRWRQNDDFAIERSFTLNYDISYSFVAGDAIGVDANLNAYHTTIDGKAVADADSLAAGTLYMVNSEEPARLAGLELQIRPSFGAHWSGSLALALVDYTLRGSDGVYRRMPLSSPISIDGSLMYHDDETAFTAEVWASHIGATTLPSFGSRDGASDPFTLVNVRVEKAFGVISVHAGVQNLLDAVQNDGSLVYGSAERYGADAVWGPLEGRELFVGVRFRSIL